MKSKIFIIASLSLLLFSCGSKEKTSNIDKLIETKNITELKSQRALLQADLTKIDEALAGLDKKATEAWLEQLIVKTMVFIPF